ncbi:VanW family protein [Micromonospora sonneratiae]
MSLYGDKQVPANEAPTVQVKAISFSDEPDPVPGPRRGAASGAAGAGPDGANPDGPATPGRRRRRALVAGGVAAVVLAAAGGTAAYAYSGEVPRGTSVLGVDLGGKSRAEATDALRADLTRRAQTLDAPVSVRIGDQTAQIKPADVGLAVDVEATVAASADAKAHPVSLLFGSRSVDPVIKVDAERLDTELRKVAGKFSPEMTVPRITFDGTTPKPVYPKPGKGLDPTQSAEALRAGWLSGQPVTIPVVDVQPATSAAEVDQLVAELAKPATAKPVTVTTDKGKFTIPGTAIAKSLVLAGDKTGKIHPRVDEKKLREAIDRQLDTVETDPRDATYQVEGGKLRPVAGAGGRQVDTEALSRDLLAVLPSSNKREINGTIKSVEPKITTEELPALGIKEKVSSFTTHFTGGMSSPRSQNIRQIAKEVDGALVKPGETFSLNGHTGPRDYAQGYRDAPVILDGKLVPGVGGGTSQFTTTLFNATYYAGLEDVEHKPHSFWFSRYPPVIESTIFYPHLDFKFRNNTPHGLVIDTSVTNSSVTVSIWSTKIWDSVTTEWSPRRNITKPKLIHLTPGPSCIATNGIDGFTQDAWRIFRKDGKEVKREKFTWRYDAEPRYVCGPKPN